MSAIHDDSDRLKLCPFCGGHGEVMRMPHDHIDAGAMFIQCVNATCMASTCLVYPMGDDPLPILMEKWNRRAAAAPLTAPLYAADTPPVGLFALRDAVRCLRETGRYIDEEGEATNALEDLLDRLSATGENHVRHS